LPRLSYKFLLAAVTTHPSVDIAGNSLHFNGLLNIDDPMRFRSDMARSRMRFPILTRCAVVKGVSTSCCRLECDRQNLGEELGHQWFERWD
jgi:hypothetical protein